MGSKMRVASSCLTMIVWFCAWLVEVEEYKSKRDGRLGSGVEDR